MGDWKNANLFVGVVWSVGLVKLMMRNEIPLPTTV